MAVGNAVDGTMVSIVNTINSIAQKYITPVVYDQVLKSNPILYRFWRKGPKLSSGPALQWPVMRDQKTNGGWYSGAGQLPHGIEDTSQPAEVLWRHVAEDITIPRTDILKATGADAKVDLVKFKFDEAIINLRARISQALWTNTPMGIDGFDLAIIDSGTYAGISHTATNSAGSFFWKPGINQDGYSATATARTITDIQDFYGRASDGDEAPTLIATTQAAFNYLFGQLQAQQRYTPDDEMAKLGFESFRFARSVVVVDRNIPAGSMYFINEDFVDLVSHSDENFAIDPIITGSASERTVNTKCVWSGNLRCYSPRYHSRIAAATNF